MKKDFLSTTIIASILLTSMIPFSSAYAQVKVDPLVAGITQQLAIESSNVLLTKIYRLRQNRPIWIQQGSWTQNAFYLVGLKAILDSHGLEGSKYFPQNLLLQIQRSSGVSPEVAARWETVITKNLLLALEHLVIGEVNPEVIEGISIKKKSSLSDASLQTIVSHLDNPSKTDLSVMVQALAPKHIAYERLRSALARLQESKMNGTWRIPGSFKKVLQVGVSDPAVGAIKSQLSVLGYQLDSLNDVYDSSTASAISDVQLAMLMKPDGKIHPTGRTITYFRDINARISEIKMNLEKLRWFNTNPEQRHIFVNLANQSLRVYDLAQDPVDPVMAFKTINGRVDRKTPAMKDVMTHVMLNPTWTVPNSIVWKDKAPDLASKTPDEILQWFDEKGFTVYDFSFNAKLNPLSIDWANVNANNIDFLMVQSPRYDNALGVVKFPLTNPWAIYLHDTNTRDLFAEANRLRSSGCVRVEYPLELTEYLLQGTEWNRQALEDYLVKPDQKDAKQKRVDLPQKMSVYMIGLSSEVDEAGVLRFPPDVYGQDAQISGYMNIGTQSVDNLSSLSLREEDGF